MKRILSLTLLYIAIATTSFAQECKMCGDWVGIYESSKPHPTEDRLIPADHKLYIRIKKVENNIIVRIKDRVADNSAEFWYMNDWKISDFSDNRIILVWDTGIDDNYGEGWGIKDGRRCAYRRDVVYASIELRQGILYFDGGTNYVTWYDSNDKIISTFNFPNHVPAKNVTLYKDDDDW